MMVFMTNYLKEIPGKIHNTKVEIETSDLLELIYWSRRYCDGRSTYAPTQFNKLYDKITSKYPELIQKDQFDHTLYKKGQFWPYAQDGMYNPDTGAYDAMNRKPKMKND